VSGFAGPRHALKGLPLAASRVGLGAELGLFSRLVVVSLNGTLHFGGTRSSRVLVPFVAGGYTQMGVGDGDGSFPAWNVAAGADYWLTRRYGVRAEFRDHIHPDDRGTVQYWSLRAGIVFR
jgi:hypothetical protein